MDQWLEAINGRVRGRQDEKAAVNVQAQNEKLRTQIIQMDMAKGMRDRSHREEMLEATIEPDVPAAVEAGVALEEWDDDGELSWSDSDRNVNEERVIREPNRTIVPILIPSINTSRGSSVVGTKRTRFTPISANKKLKLALKDPAVIIGEQFRDAMERSIGGLCAQLSILTENLASPVEQGQRLLKPRTIGNGKSRIGH
jgi:hypothetical protein